MIKMPFSDMVAKIRQKTGLSEEEVQSRIEQKHKSLSGLISKEGAAYIIANELGIKLIENTGKIKDMYPGMRNVELAGRVVQVFEPKDFVRADESMGRVGSFLLADETGTIRVVCWAEHAKTMEKLTQNSTVRISGGSVRENNRGFKEIHLSQNSKLIINPPGLELPEIEVLPKRKQIKELTEADQMIEIAGTIVQVADPKFFEICPQCGARLKELEGSWVCDEHAAVLPDYSYLVNVYLDDGSESIRVVLFKNQAERLLNKTKEQMLVYRETPESFESIKTALLGEQFRFIGRARLNPFFNNIEFIATKVMPMTEAELKESQPSESENQQSGKH